MVAVVDPVKAPTGVHVRDRGGVPPIAEALMEPLFTPLHTTVLVETAETVIAGGEPMV
jgi:hypothetical protein